MITIRSSKAGSQVALICLEATLTTSGSVYSISSEGAMTDSGSSFDGNLFGPISWPVSRFRLADGLLLEQQLFLPHDGSAVALSWSLQGNVPTAQLVLRPFFCGCGPRSYRDVGFYFDADEQGGRLSWLPNVRGPKIFADTNGRYHDEPVRLFDCLCEQAEASASEQDLIMPGRFEFELGRRPSVLIFSMERRANTQCDQHIGAFLAGLMPRNASARTNSTAGDSAGIQIQQLAIT